MVVTPAPATTVEFFLVIRPERIGWLRFILEGYDGLALLTTLSAGQGLVRIRTLRCGLHETMRLLKALAPTLTRIERTAPAPLPSSSLL